MCFLCNRVCKLSCISGSFNYNSDSLLVIAVAQKGEEDNL